MKSGFQILFDYFHSRGFEPFPFQLEVWKEVLEGRSGLLNAPTGSGKTFALWAPVLAEYIDNNPDYKKARHNGLQILWLTPLRALAKDIQLAMEQVVRELEIPWAVSARTGDTSAAERQRQKQSMPECLITTPESLHLFLSQTDSSKVFKNLKTIVVDEWHELLGTKRAVQVELALSKVKKLTQQKLKIWGISATIGNLPEALEVLLGKETKLSEAKIIKADIKKSIQIESIIPDEIEKFPWAGHLGINLLDKAIPIIRESQTTLLFTNTRSQTEIWYQHILLRAPDLAGAIAMHHGSLDNEIRKWVEEALHSGILKLVVCTSSLDLGVDFRPVDTVIQVGSPKGVARFLQRAGRSGHQPGATSKIFFLPTHSLELVEASAIKEAIYNNVMESRTPLFKSFDVLVQYLLTLATGEGFKAEEVLEEIKTTFSFKDITESEWKWALDFIVHGGESLGEYNEYQKVEQIDGLFRITNKRMAMKHRLSIGTIVSDPIIKIKYMTGGFIGTVEEYFVSRLNPGDVFWFAGKNLEFIKIKDMTALVKKGGKKKGVVPRWLGGRIALSSQLSELIRIKLEEAKQGIAKDIETKVLKPLFDLQLKWSTIPDHNQLLVELLESNEGHHIFIYPFEGRMVHEVLGALIAYRISRKMSASFSIAMNDYGFELLSEQKIDEALLLDKNLFSTENLVEDIRNSVNESEMAKRKFRDIAAISGLIFQGYPGKYITNKHLQSSTQILFQVFKEYDPGNLLIHQAYEEVLTIQVEQARLANTLRRITQQSIIFQHLKRPSPFAFPILVDRLRESLSSEKLEDRVNRMVANLEKFA